MAVCILAASTVVGLTAFRNPTTFEVGLLQLLSWQRAYTVLTYSVNIRPWLRLCPVIQPHARGAFRRVTALYKSLHRLSERIEELKTDQDDPRLDLIQALVNEQIATGQDDMEDWRDIVPEEVEQIERRLPGNDQSG